MKDYRPSRAYDDRLPRDETFHADSRRRSNDDGPASPSDNGIISIGEDGLQVALIRDFADMDFDIISRYARAASRGAPDSMLNADEFGAFMKGGLAYQSAEDIRFEFAVRGASRVLTHQLVRTRQAAFKQQSQRDCWYGDHPEFRMPESVWTDKSLRDRWIGVLRAAHRVYNEAIEQDIPYEDARYILPEGTTNFIMCEYSLRTFLEMYAYRACVMFQAEMVKVVRAMGKLIVESHPYLEPHVKITCEKLKKCTFQGPERVDRTCDFPWANEDSRTHPIKAL
jgi:thymidylate synthase (FAD)